MWPNPQETTDLVTFTKEILNEILYFLCRANNDPSYRRSLTLKCLIPLSHSWIYLKICQKIYTISLTHEIALFKWSDIQSDKRSGTSNLILTPIINVPLENTCNHF